MLEVWKSLLNSEADGPHGHAVGEQNIADDVPPHQPLALFLPGKKGCGVHGHAVRPRQEGVLAPPPRHYQGHIEPKYKCEGDGGQLLMAVGTQGLKQLAGLLPLKEDQLKFRLVRVCTETYNKWYTASKTKIDNNEAGQRMLEAI